MFRIGLGVGRPLPSFGAFDSDAQAFLSAAGITGATETAAVNTLVTSLKGYGIWSKMKAIYPFVGGTASTHKYNLKDPRDLDAAFRLVFNGGWTHSSTGATPNGTNGYADTKLIPSANLSLNSTHLSYYSRTNISQEGVDMGTWQVTDKMCYLLYTYNGTAYKAINRAESVSGSNFTPTTGLLIGNRPNSSTEKYYHKGVLIDTLTTSSGGLSTIPIYIGAFNNGSASQFITKQTAFNSIGDGLTDTEASNLYTAVQAFQTSLSRQV